MELGFERPEESPNSNWRADLPGIPGAQEQLSARADRMVSFPQLDVAGLWPDGLVAAQYELALSTDDSAAAIANGMIELGRKSP